MFIIFWGFFQTDRRGCVELLRVSGTDRGKVFPVTPKSRKFFSYCGSSTASFSHCTECSTVQLWTGRGRRGTRGGGEGGEKEREGERDAVTTSLSAGARRTLSSRATQTVPDVKK